MLGTRLLPLTRRGPTRRRRPRRLDRGPAARASRLRAHERPARVRAVIARHPAVRALTAPPGPRLDRPSRPNDAALAPVPEVRAAHHRPRRRPADRQRRDQHLLLLARDRAQPDRPAGREGAGRGRPHRAVHPRHRAPARLDHAAGARAEGPIRSSRAAPSTRSCSGWCRRSPRSPGSTRTAASRCASRGWRSTSTAATTTTSQAPKFKVAKAGDAPTTARSTSARRPSPT